VGLVEDGHLTRIWGTQRETSPSERRRRRPCARHAISSPRWSRLHPCQSSASAGTARW
jgi:hypothetical protein